MITDSFDNLSPAKINPEPVQEPKVDACIMTFSYQIEAFVLENFDCEKIGEMGSVNGATPVYRFSYAGKTFAFFKTHVGAPACAGDVESSRTVFRTDKYILFGGAGCLNKEIARGKVMVPTAAYRDEGTSYHYVPAADYIDMPNAKAVAAFMEENGIPYALGKTWSTDAFFRETNNNFEKRKAEGCLSVEMESAGVQAVCQFRGLQLYVFFTSGDLLDAPKWDMRMEKGQVKFTQHDTAHFAIALELAAAVS